MSAAGSLQRSEATRAPSAAKVSSVSTPPVLAMDLVSINPAQAVGIPIAPLPHRLLRAIAERQRWRAAYEAAKDGEPPPPRVPSATARASAA